ncbi:hypothetical protein BGZ79_003751 [Entomortierella chlamydospora]|nr:hypothetical protein BGZ79_003751 [Entomortierella chlamydospora]
MFTIATIVVMLSATRFYCGRCIRQSLIVSYARLIGNPLVIGHNEFTSRTASLVKSRLVTLSRTKGNYDQIRAFSTRKIPKSGENFDPKKSVSNNTSNSGVLSSRTRGKDSSLSSETSTSTTIPTAAPKPSSLKSKAKASSPPKDQSKEIPEQVNISIPPDYKHLKVPPHQEFKALQALVDELLLTNSSLAKRATLARHPEQASLLAWIYDPQRQFFVTSSNISKHAQSRARQLDNLPKSAVIKMDTLTGTMMNSLGLSAKQQADTVIRSMALGDGYDTLSELLDALSTRTIVGHTALDAILIFMDRFCHDDASNLGSTFDGKCEDAMTQLLDSQRSKLLLKILDKNLKTGCNVAMIREIYPTLIPGFHVSLGQSLSGLDDARKLFEPKSSVVDDESTGETSTTSTRKKRKSKRSSAVKREEGWFASRKLDGVRCLIRMDRLTGRIESYSRQGRSLESLTSLHEALRSLISSDSCKERHDPQNWDLFFKRALGCVDSKEQPLDAEKLPATLYLDGELCVFTKELILESDASKEKDDVNNEGLVTIGESEGDLGPENFLKAVSIAKTGLDEVEPETENDVSSKTDLRKDTAEAGTVTESLAPMYCVFDCLTDTEFKDRKGTRPFSTRIQGVVNALASKGTGGDNAMASHASMIKVLKQTKIESVAQLEKMIDKSAELEWEGLILRKDIGYEGKRSRSMLKIKKFHDAEFTVQDAMIGSMRVPLGGQYVERDNVLTNVVILHHGNKVRVGSGFSMEDRVRFGKDPSLIIGKTITVKYFEESQTMANADGGIKGAQAVWSLRFPTVKAIYGAGPRQI